MVGTVSQSYLVYIPFGIIGLWRWSVWVIKRSLSMLYKPIAAYDVPKLDMTTIGIVTPVYQERPEIFKEALESWERNSPDELIAVIDIADDACMRIFRKFSENKPWAKMIITSKPGKRQALATGIGECKSQIVAVVDSDTIWAQSNRAKLLAPFKDPEICGVTAKCIPIERNTIWQKLTDIFWDTRNYIDLPSQVVMGRALSCLSGRTSLYRREVILPKLDEFLNEVILGVRKESGEDKCLTRLIQKQGWKTYYQSDAEIYSFAAEDFRTFWSQRLRWARNSHNSDLVSIFKDKMWKRNPYLVFFMLDRFVSMFTILLGPIYFAVAMYRNDWIIGISILLLWIIGRGIRISPHLLRQPKDVLMLPLYVVISFAYAVVKIYALVSITEQKWIRKPCPSIIEPSKGQHIVRNIKDVVLTLEIMCLVVLPVLILTA